MYFDNELLIIYVIFYHKFMIINNFCYAQKSKLSDLEEY